jgi:hypothetical protein
MMIVLRASSLVLGGAWRARELRALTSSRNRLDTTRPEDERGNTFPDLRKVAAPLARTFCCQFVEPVWAVRGPRSKLATNARGLLVSTRASERRVLPVAVRVGCACGTLGLPTHRAIPTHSPASNLGHPRER